MVPEDQKVIMDLQGELKEANPRHHKAYQLLLDPRLISWCTLLPILVSSTEDIPKAM